MTKKSEKDSADKASAKGAKDPVQTKPIEELILNYTEDKYTAIPLAAIWAKELRRREEHRNLTATEVLELALREVLSGAVDAKTIKKAAEANGDGAENGAEKTKGK